MEQVKMNTKSAIIEITLKSDLCMGSGYSYAGTIDSDVCYDAIGIPYIPAKRMKGCLREAAESILQFDKSNPDFLYVFGESNANGVRGIRLENGYIKDYAVVREELDTLSQKYPKLISQQNILEEFTHIQAQTALENGIADDNSLRFTRVVNQYSVLPNHPEMVFVMNVYFEDNSENTIEAWLTKIVKATRNIGLKRNRGLGSVSCKLVNVASCDKDTKIAVCDNESADELCKITYVLRNTEALMLSAKGDNTTEKYITGQRVLGFLAKKYLEQQEFSAEDEAFQALFLNQGGNVRYTNAYPYKDGERYYPVPEYVNRLKITGDLVNTFADSGKLESGNIPKRLKGKFVNEVGATSKILDVDTTIIYHHSHKEADEIALYSVEAIAENQMFAGDIYVPKKYESILMKLLSSKDLHFGKSITAQYGKCVLESIVSEQIKSRTESVNLKKDDYVLVTLQSDAVFVNPETGDYTVYNNQVEKILAHQLGLNVMDKVEEENDTRIHSRIRTKIVNGYQMKWNLRKQPIPVIEAGSTIVLQVSEAIELQNIPRFIGEKNHEGYGEIKVQKLERDKFVIQKKEKEFSDEISKNYLKKADLENKNVLTKEIAEQIYVNYKLNERVLNSFKDANMRISKSALGRVTLMLKESLEKTDTPEAALNSFVKRIASIKSDSVREEVKQRILLNLVKADGEWEIKKLTEWKDNFQREIKDSLGVEEIEDMSEWNADVNKHWGAYLLTVLQHQKYMKGEEQESNE